MRRAEEFARTIRGGSRAGRTTVVVHCRAHEAALGLGAEGCRIGLVVSKAVGGAVVRNKVRRRIRGVILDHRALLPGGADVVVRALPAAATASYPELAADLRSALGAAARKQGVAA